MTPCDVVVERLALGEPLDALAEHIASCPGCKRLVAMPRQLGAAHAAVDPGLGFSARMTAGAQHRIGVRRRRRVAVGLAATVAAGALGVVVFVREPARTQSPVATNPIPAPTTQVEVEAPAGEDDLKMLIDYADTRRTLKLSANWERIEETLDPYRKLVEDVEPADDAEGEEP